MEIYHTVRAWNPTARLHQSLLAGPMLCASVVLFMLAMFANAVEVSVEEADPLLHVVSVHGHHSVSHHLLFANETLQFITFESLQPAGGQNKVFGMSLKISCGHKGRWSVSAQFKCEKEGKASESGGKWPSCWRVGNWDKVQNSAWHHLNQGVKNV